VRADGATIWTTRSLSLIRDSNGLPSYFVAQLDDVTDARDAREQLAYLAHHDELTGLHNRAWILDLIERSLMIDGPCRGRVGALFIDLDHFKVVNDSLGHSAGDDVLRSVAARLAGPLGEHQHLGRLGGDEFVVVVPDARSHVELERLAANISAALAVDLVIRGHRIVPHASIGIALASVGATAASLLRDADVALYRAKHAGRGRWQVFDDAMHARALQRLTVEDDVRRGLERDEFVVHLQPIVRLGDESIAGFEALVRWQHPSKGLLAPDAFLSVAEESGLVVPLGQQVLEHVCAILARHPSLPGRISVNVSAVQLSRSDWLSSFADTLRRSDADPNRLIVEVTETAVLSLLDSVRADLFALRRLGVGIHVDDFGTGYSSISLLRELPVTGLKLDRSFVADLTDGESSANALAAGLIGLAAGLGLQSVAEGVETRSQATLLRSQGWRYGQGYLFGRPASIEAWTGERG
jgi:diguanylate cyclase (GGDEF)-like protein